MTSESWVLMAVVYGGGKRGASLRSILGAGDYINHAVMSYEELSSGLVWLLGKGLLTESNGLYFPSSEVWTAFNRPIKPRRNVLTEWHALEEYLQAFGPDLPAKPVQVVAREDYEQALNNYLYHFKSP